MHDPNNMDKHISPRLKLKKFLKKMGINKAEPTLQEQIDELVSALSTNFGKPDELMLDVASFEALGKIFK